jgi:hypothetical protein
MKGYISGNISAMPLIPENLSQKNMERGQEGGSPRYNVLNEC